MQELHEFIAQQPYTRFITPKRVMLVILGVIVLGVLATSYYTVEADEIAVVLMFGEICPASRTRTPLQITTRY